MAVVAATAIRGWTLLLSTLPAYRLAPAFVEGSLEALAERLYSEATDVREAAGEAIALLYDATGLADLEGNSGETIYLGAALDCGNVSHLSQLKNKISTELGSEKCTLCLNAT